MDKTITATIRDKLGMRPAKPKPSMSHILRIQMLCGVFLRHGRHLLTNRYMARSTILHRSLILGLETSCDDTGACVMDLSGKVLGESLSTQLSSRMGGVIHTFAMTFHAQSVEGVVNDCLARAGARWRT